MLKFKDTDEVVSFINSLEGAGLVVTDESELRRIIEGEHFMNAEVELRFRPEPRGTRIGGIDV